MVMVKTSQQLRSHLGVFGLIIYLAAQTTQNLPSSKLVLCHNVDCSSVIIGFKEMSKVNLGNEMKLEFFCSY